MKGVSNMKSLTKLNSQIENLHEQLVKLSDARRRMHASDTRRHHSVIEQTAVVKILVKRLKERTALVAELAVKKEARNRARGSEPCNISGNRERR